MPWSILYSGLAAPLPAAFIVMLGEQRFNRYTRVDRRQRKMNGMVTCHFDLVMEYLFQAALLPLVYVLSNHLFIIDKVVASVSIGFTSFGPLFYLLISSPATPCYNHLSQTPLSTTPRLLVRFDNNHRKYLGGSGKWLKRLFSQKKRPGPKSPSGPYSLDRFGTSTCASFSPVVGTHPPPVVSITLSFSRTPAQRSFIVVFYLFRSYPALIFNFALLCVVRDSIGAGQNVSGERTHPSGLDV